MLLGVVVAQGVPSLEHLATNNTGMCAVQVDFCVSLHSLFGVKHFATSNAAVLRAAVVTPPYHPLDCGIDV